MRVTFWGTRGSIATPGRATVRYGGNTACVGVRLAAGPLLILDAGTGLRVLGQSPEAGAESAFTLLLSHWHWDHIQGFPFFAPAYRPGCRIDIIGGSGGPRHLKRLLSNQMERDYFPVPMTEMQADIHFHAFGDGGKAIGSARARTCPTRHPGGGWGFRIEDRGEDGGGVLVYLTDNELPSPGPEWDAFCGFCAGADLLIHDAQYREEELPAHRGWGHSTDTQATRLALDAGCRRLALFHHDPGRSDAALDEMIAACRALAASASSDLDVFAAAEGQTHEIGGSEPPAPASA